MAVAAKLQAHARNWSNAYQLLRRMHAYELMPQIGIDHDDVARLAAIETAFVECSQLGASEVVVADSVPEHILERMNPIEGAPLIRPAAVTPDDVRRAYCTLGEAPDASMRPQDISCDIVQVMERFPIFPAATA